MSIFVPNFEEMSAIIWDSCDGVVLAKKLKQNDRKLECPLPEAKN